MRVLVVGSTGFIGRALVRRLGAMGHDVATFDRASGNDFQRQEEVLMKVANADVVIYLAGISSPSASEVNPYETARVNILAPLLFAQCAAHSDTRMIFLSSSHVYGEGGSRPSCESDIFMFGCNSFYGASKRATEGLLSYLRARGLRTTVLRLSNVYGPGERCSSVVCKFLERADRGEKIVVHGVGDLVKTPLYIDDAIDAISRVAEKEDILFEAINIGGNRSFTLLEIAEKCLEVAESKSEIKLVPRTGPRFDVDNDAMNLYRANGVIKWAPRVGLEEGLGEVLRWMREERKQ